MDWNEFLTRTGINKSKSTTGPSGTTVSPYSADPAKGTQQRAAVASVGSGGLGGGYQKAQTGDYAGAAKSIGTGGVGDASSIMNMKFPGMNDLGLANPNLDEYGHVTVPQMPAGSAPTFAPAAGTFAGGTIAPTGAAPGMAQINDSQSLFRNAQAGLLQQLQAQANGTGPSVVAGQYRQAQQANQAALMSQLASQRGAANPLAARTAALANSQQQAQLGQNAAIARLQEQQGAQQALGNFSTGARQQDIGVALSNQQAQNEAKLTQYRGDLQRAVAQGQLDQRTAETMYQAQQNANIENAKIGMQFQDLQKQYLGMGVDAERANQLAALKANELKMAGVKGNRTLAGDIVSGAAGAVGTVYGGPAAGAAAASVAGDATSGTQNNAAPADDWFQGDGPKQSYQNLGTDTREDYANPNSNGYAPWRPK